MNRQGCKQKNEEMVYRSLNACETETELRVTSDHGRQILRPVYLKADTRLGRWYLFGATEQGAELVRLSKITELEPLSTHFDYREAEAQVERILGDSLISQGNRRTTIEAELHFENEPGQRKQFEREMLCGRILLRGATEIYQAELNDVGELRELAEELSPFPDLFPESLSLLQSCHLIEGKGEPHSVPVEVMERAVLSMLEPERVVLRVKKEKNALERCFLCFEGMEGLSGRILREDVYEVSFSFFAFDRNDILKKLLYLGECVTLREPESLKRELVKTLRHALERQG